MTRYLPPRQCDVDFRGSRNGRAPDRLDRWWVTAAPWIAFAALAVALAFSQGCGENSQSFGFRLRTVVIGRSENSIPPPERVSLHPYTRKDLGPSKFAANAMVVVREWMLCPRCAAEMPIVQHGERRSCPDCGLWITVYGNCLQMEGETITLTAEQAKRVVAAFSKEVAK